MNGNVTELFQPAHTLIGQGSINEIPRFMSSAGVSKALVVTDKGLEKLGTVKLVTDVLDANNVPYSVYDRVEPNPSVRVVNEAAEVFKSSGADFLVAIGGGSPIDVAKAVSILTANGGDIRDYMGVAKSLKPGNPIVAINTTAGTGSEVTRVYVVTDEEKKIKMVMVDNNCMAYLAIDDPDLMVGMPPALTAATGMDALTHAVEAFLCNPHTPFSDGAAIEAIRLVSKSLKRAVEYGRDVKARTDMCWAEYLAGLAFSNSGLGLVHAIAHQLGGMYHTPHGIANAIMLPFVMEFNLPYRTARVARIGHAWFDNTEGFSDEKAAKHAIERIRNLSKSIGIPSLCDTPFDPKDVHILAENALRDATAANNYVKATQQDVEDIIMNAYTAGIAEKVKNEIAKLS